MSPVETLPPAARRIVRYQTASAARGHAILRGDQGDTRILLTGRALPVAGLLRIDEPGREWRGSVALCRPGRADAEYVVVVVVTSCLREAV